MILNDKLIQSTKKLTLMFRYILNIIFCVKVTDINTHFISEKPLIFRKNSKKKVLIRRLKYICKQTFKFPSLETTKKATLVWKLIKKVRSVNISNKKIVFFYKTINVFEKWK